MKKLISTIMLIGLTMVAMGQKSEDPVMFEIGGQQIRQSEFMKEFLASIGKDPSSPKTACTYEKRQALEEYVELFANFRTKLADAYALGYDTMSTITNELKQYRAELAAPYLLDSTSLNEILAEAYERNHYVVHAAHILVKCDQNAAPEDTLTAYRRAMEIYKKAVSGENFNKLAWDEENRTKEVKNDLEKKKNPNAGDLGYFTVFDMIYPFESAVYGLKVGEISKPVRTRFGYHVVKLVDKKSFYGESKLQHVWVRGDQDTTKGQKKIEEAYRRLQNGEAFESVAKNCSDDRTTFNEGGRLPVLPVTKLPLEYVEKIADGMKDGEYTKPFHTQYGWHIVKLLHHEEIPTFEEMVPVYKQRLTRDQRSSKPKDRFVEEAKKKYGFVDYTKEYEKLKNGKLAKEPKATLQPIIDEMNDSIFAKKWDYDKKKMSASNNLFELDGKKYGMEDLANYIKTSQKIEPKRDYGVYVRDSYDKYVRAMVMKCADENLEKDNAEFAELMTEYRNGLMIFAYNDDMIWSKAIRDTTGFKAFYYVERAKKDINNPEDSNYFWNERARTMVVTVADSNLLSSTKAMKIIDKGVKKRLSQNDIKANLVKAFGKNSNGEKKVSVVLEMLEEGHQKELTRNEWRKGMYCHPEGKGYKVLVVEQMINPELKSQQEARGYYITDFQNMLERDLNDRLKHKYNVKIHRDVVDETTY